MEKVEQLLNEAEKTISMLFEELRLKLPDINSIIIERAVWYVGIWNISSMSGYISSMSGYIHMNDSSENACRYNGKEGLMALLERLHRREVLFRKFN